MRTKLLLRHSGGQVEAITLSCDAAATAGDVADHLVGSEPDPALAAGSVRLRVWAPGSATSHVLSRDITVADAGLRSGSTLVLDCGTARDQGPLLAAIRVQVVKGPDTGLVIDLPVGVPMVGRHPDCAVVLSDVTCSGRHARLVISPSDVKIYDNGSANGVVVNGGLVRSARLADGDLVQLGETTVRLRWLASAPGGSPGDGASTQLMVSQNEAVVPFNRSPVVAHRYPEQQVTAPTPPEPSKPQPLGWLAMLAPALMGGAMYTVTRNPMSLLFVGMSPLMVLGGWFDRRRGARRRLAQDTKRFRDDLDALTAKVRHDQAREVEVRCAEHPPAASWADAAATLAPALWSRRPADDDFLSVRVGMGTDTSRTTIALPPRGTAGDELWNVLTGAVEPLEDVGPVPLTTPLRQVGSIGVAGTTEAAHDATRNVVAQLAAQCSPAHLRVAVIASPRTAQRWAWVPWLPHVAPGPWLASDPAAAVTCVAALEELVAQRTAQNTGSRVRRHLPAVLVVVVDDAPVERGRLVRLAADGPAAGVHVLWCAERVTALPEACRAWVDTDARVLGLPDEHQTRDLECDGLDLDRCWQTALALSGVVDAGEPDTDESDLPRAVDWLSLVGTGLASDPSAVRDRWRETGRATPDARRQPANLRAVVGRGADGQFVLDLRNEGPHALVGGTTGAGKSEFLQTWVLAMAASHSPARVTFLFVDYKGGAAFADCVDLPHCVGLVTDLTPHLVRRALTSLRAELHHRERLLATVKAKDLAAMERTGDPRTPPSLVIVVDEFAALVGEVPQFVDGMVDVAQRGRSLGLHLVLATQRPAGVIKDNLRANTNLRIALRTADEHDSTDVVGVPVTAHIDPAVPGRAAVRTGPGRVTMFQTAYVGGRSTGAPPAPTIDVESLDVGPGRPWDVPPTVTPGTVAADDGPTDLRLVVGQITEAARQACLPDPRRPWLPSLEPCYDLAALAPAPPRWGLGVVDLPESQSQQVWGWNPDDGALAVFGASGAGASTMLRSIAVAGGTADPGRTHVYGLDFGAGGLAMLEPLPFVGAIIDATDPERTERLLRDLLAMVEDRTRRFAAVRAGSLDRYRELAGRPDEPRVVLLVDGLSAFRDAYETASGRAASFTAFRRVLTEGRPLGVHVVLSAERVGAIPTSLGSAIQVRMVMRQADPNAYRALDVPVDVLDPASPPGRAVLASSGHEVQIAVPGGDADPAEQARAVDALAARLRAAGAPQAPAVRRLPTAVPASSLPAHVGGRPVLGIAEDTLAPVGFTPTGAFVVAGPPGSGRSTAVAWFAASLHRWDQDLPLYYLGGRRSTNARLPLWAATATTVDDVVALVKDLTDPVAAPTDGDGDGDHPGLAIVVESLTDLLGTPAEQPLTALVKTARRNGHLILAESETPTWGSAWPLVAEVRNTRRGIALTPDAVDGETLFRTSFGRASRAQFPPGRGIYVESGVTRTIQLPQP